MRLSADETLIVSCSLQTLEDRIRVIEDILILQTTCVEKIIESSADTWENFPLQCGDIIFNKYPPAPMSLFLKLFDKKQVCTGTFFTG